jgi:hypothetical protein
MASLLGAAIAHTDLFVCVSKTLQVHSSVANPLLEWIEHQLEGRTAKTWAVDNGIFIDNYQEYRHAWIDHMIKVLES